MVKLANRLRIPVVPRAGGTGLADGAVPLRGGILVDVKLMNQIHEIDLVDRTVTVGPGINMLKLNEELKRHGVFYPDDPASYPCSLVGGRIGTGGWSLLGARFGHTRDNVDLDGGRAAHGRDRRDRRGRRAQAAPVLDRVQPQAAVHRPSGDARHLHRGDARARAAAGGRVRRVLRLRRLHEGVRDTGVLTKSGLATLAGRRPLRRVEGRLPAPRRRGLHPAAGLGQGGRGGRHVRHAAPRSSRPPSASWRSAAASAASTSATRSRRRLGLAPRPLRHAAARPLARRPGGDHVVALRGRRAQLLRPARRCARSGTRSSRATASATASSTTGACSPTPAGPASRGPTTSSRSTWASGSSASTRRRGPAGWPASARSPRYRWPTAARSPPATARRARATPSSCRPRWAARGRWSSAIKRALDPNNVMNPGKQSLDEAYE